ncbi:hypothetical protein THAOC_31926 [Thalassiosira oceanica]|uniref:Uncharacterized protein n=1 Tax=Thalassiosira oceanica TaxID=159749 RepID=K0RAF2_THAOC|nr:hypothetical protein THAOC_31926 [Thalassiosira oceanica]|eukprot:EJK49224.1 hypothetical protein THAOC_31926 [Thalassiosira oceanica]
MGGDPLQSKSKMTDLGKSSFEEVSSAERSLGHLTLATSMEGQEAMECHQAETRTGLWPITSDESSGMKSMGETCDMCSCLKHLAAALTANISQKNLHTFEMERCTEARIGGLRGENVHGENLALNYGFGSKAATVNTADSILKRWTEDEVDLQWPQNGHLTQAQSTSAVRMLRRRDQMGGHATLRYARPGNCNVGRYITGDKMWWLDPVMQDTSPCGPACPPDGCT